MEKSKVSPKIIIDGHTVVCATEYTQEQPPRLTPTGKISHAKTRVYTQRYRKEWELMPDFKGDFFTLLLFLSPTNNYL